VGQEKKVKIRKQILKKQEEKSMQSPEKSKMFQFDSSFMSKHIKNWVMNNEND